MSAIDDGYLKAISPDEGSVRRYPSKCLHHLFEDQATRVPDAPAVAYGDEVLTYEEVERAANRLARTLQEAGIGREDRVALYLTRRAEWVVGIVGILKAGAAYVPIDPGYPEDRVRFMIGDCGATTVVTEQSLRRHVPSSVEAVDLDRLLEARASDDDHTRVDVASDPSDLAYVIYTSGSTGTPKGTLIEHGHVSRLLSATEHIFDFNSSDVWTLFHSPAFDFSVWEIWGALAYGGQVVVIGSSARTPEQYYEALRRHGVTVVNQTPQALRGLARTILERGHVGLRIRVAVSGGERLSPGVVRSWSQAWEGDPPRLVNMYGITETTVHVTFHTVSESDGDEAAPSVIGRPLPDLRVYVLDPSGEPVPAGEVGEMFVGGAGVARGYLGRPQLTRERFLADPFLRGEARMYRTGDLARFRSDGALEYVGRSDDQVKLRGYRIELGEVDAALAALPTVTSAAASVHGTTDGDRRLVGYYVGAGMGTKAMRDELQKRLPEYMVPALLVQLDALPLTPNGKVDRGALPAPGDARPELDTPYVAPRDESERLLADLWADVLKVGRVGINDNFFDLGGDSILAVAVGARASQHGMEFSVGDLFSQRTIAGLCGRIALGDAERGVLPGFNPVKHRPRRVAVTQTQAQACLISQLAQEALPYQFQATITFRGRLDDGLLVDSLQAIVDRHEILRSHFVRRKGTWCQVVDPHLSVDVPVVDVGSDTDTDMVAAVGALSHEFFGQRIDVDVAPLVRWKLLRLGDDHHVLLHVEHHLLHDGWSWNVFLGELVTLYRVGAGAEPQGVGILPPLRAQFGDFAAWQGQIAGSALGAAQLAYWKEQLTDLPPPLALASDRPRPRQQSFRGSRVVVTLPEDLVERLRSVCSAHDVTLFMTMLSAFYVLLNRYSGQDDVLVGSGIVNRRLPPFENLIGMVLNTVALRGDLKDDPTVEELLRRVRQTAVDAFANQDLPFEEVLQAVHPQRRAGAAPLYQVMFSFQDPPWADLDLPGMALQVDDTVGNGSSKADVNVIVLNRRTQSDSLTLMWEYATDLFDESEAQSMVDSYLCLLDAITRDPSTRISHLPATTPPVREHLLALAGRDSAYEREASIAEVFESRATEVPDEPALVWDGGSLTYDELNRRANRLAHRLVALGAADGRVVVAVPRSPEAIVSVLAAVKAGSAYVALDTTQPRARIESLVGDAQPAVICTTSDRVEKLPRMAVPTLVLDDEVWEGERDTNLGRVIAPGAAAYIAYTSGSSGAPKGVVVPNRAVIRLVRGADFVRFDRDESFLLLAPLAFDASTFEIWGPLLNGARLAVAPDVPLGPQEIADLVDRLGVTTLWLTAGLFHQVVDFAPAALSRLSQALTGGDVLSPDHVGRALNALPPGAVLVNGYGPTEGTTFTTCHRMATDATVDGAVPIGRPLPNSRVYIVDEYDDLVPPGVPGELLIGGDGVALGYHNQPELTAAAFVPDRFGPDPTRKLYRSGDRGRWRSDGTIEFLGRIDRQVKIRGFRIEPEAVERTLREHPLIVEAAADVRAVGQDRQLVAYVTPELDADSLGEVRLFLRERLPSQEIPSHIMAMDVLPLSHNGKIDVRALVEPPPAARGESQGSAAGGALERQLLAIWSDVLDVPALRPDDDFFDVGGHSLLAVDLFARVERELGLRLPLSTIFEAPTVRELSGVMSANGWDKPWRSLARLRTTGSRPPLFFVTAGDGNSVGFGALARRLGPDQPFYALQPRGQDGRRLVDVGVTRMARRYVRAVRGVQRTGPYVLGGRCFGTLVAFEMARHLEQAGEAVSLLIALDSVGPQWTPRTMANGLRFDEVMNLARCYEPGAPPARGDLFASARAAEEFVEWLGEPVDVHGELAVSRYVYAAYRARPDLQAAYPLAAGRHAGLLGWTWVGGRSEMGMNPQLIPAPTPEVRAIPPSTDPRHRTRPQRFRGRATDWLDVGTQGRVSTLADRRQDRLLELASGMVLEYRAGPCAARVALIRSEEYRDDAQLARWYGAETGGVEEFYVKGSHLSMMREPDVSWTARCVEACVDRVMADGARSRG
jgi:amino acid adenylation domain-containing protein